MSDRFKWLVGSLVIIGVAVLIVPTIFSQTQDPATLEAQLQNLFNQVSALQAQLNTVGSNSANTRTANVADCAFDRNLFSGTRGEDVRCLQQYLNTHGFELASAGVGSLNNETNHFGELTRRAVAKWQRAHGLTPDAGYFGPLSRAKYSELISGKKESSAPSSVRLDSITPASGAPGARITLRGSGFTDEKNRLNFGGVSDIHTDLVGQRNSIIVIDVPENLCRENSLCLSGDLQTGKYLISVANVNGESNAFEFQVTAAPISVTEIIPAEGRPGTMVTISGFGFTPTGNTIFVGDAIINHRTVTGVASADGKTLTFTYNPPAPHPENFEGIESLEQFLEVLEIEGMTFSQFETNYTDDYQIIVQNGRGERSTDFVFFRGRGALPF